MTATKPLTVTQMRVYRALAALPQPARTSDIAHTAAASAPVATHSLRRLAHYGYVRSSGGGERGKPRFWLVTDLQPPQETRQPGALTERQQEVIDAIARYWQEHGYGPAIRDLCQALDIASPNGLMYGLRSLQKKGMILWDENKARSLRLIRPARSPEGILSVSRTPEGIYVGDYGPLSAYQALDLAGRISLEASHLEAPAR